MPAARTSQRLQQLLSRRPDLWRGRRRPAGDVLPTGRSGLDGQLPTGGWPRGRLTEFLPAVAGTSATSLLLPALAGLTRQSLPVVFAGPLLVPYPQGLARAGLDLKHLLVLEPKPDVLWAAEQCLKSGLCGAVLVWHPPGRVQPKAIRRLQLAAGNGAAPVFVWYHPGQQPPSSIATLRLAVHPGPELEILRSRISPAVPESGSLGFRLKT